MSDPAKVTGSSFDQFNRLEQGISDLGNVAGNQRLRGANGSLEASGRKRHFLSIGAWGRENAALTRETQETARMLRDAMVSKFGSNVGNRIFSLHISKRQVEGTASIRAADVRRMFLSAQGLTRQSASRAIQTTGLSYDESGGMKEVLRKASRAAHTKFGPLLRDLSAKAQLLLENTTHDLFPLQRQQQELEGITRELQEASAEIARVDTSQSEFGDAGQKKLLGQLSRLVEATSHRATELQAEIAELPTKADSFAEYLDMATSVAIKLAEELKGTTEFPGNQHNLEIAKGRISDLRERHYMEHRQEGPITADDVRFIKELPASLATIIANHVNSPQAAASLRRRINQGITRALEQRPWNTVSREFTVVQGGKPTIATSTMIPASKINGLSESMKADGINGIVSNDQARPNHGVNIWSTELRAGGRQLYQGTRHAVNSAYQIADPALRREGNKARAREVITAAFSQHPQFAELLTRAKRGEAIDFPMASTSLLTPDPLRSSFSAEKGERAQLQDQLQAWNDVVDSAGECKITVKDGDQDVVVTLRPQVLTFNYGVNQGAQYRSMAPVSGWDMSNEINIRSLSQLIGDINSPRLGGIAGRKVRELEQADPRTAEKIRILADQIKMLQSSGGYNDPAEDPFRIPARISLLSYLCGMAPCFNCKSGKDRTGQLDNAIKELALSLDNKMEGLGLSTKADKERVETLRTVAMNGGGLEVTRINTALRGYKLTGVEGTLGLFGEEGRKAFQGLSKYSF
ncbi:MAG: hypothetical protein K6A65_04240 [Succinivibrionaceae bacterium]|nr:hypothetical protein [Succinivibrionaceae bacterium]